MVSRHIALALLFIFLGTVGCAGGVVMPDPSLAGGQTEGGSVSGDTRTFTNPDHVQGVVGTSQQAQSGGVSIYSRITPFPKFSNTNNLTLRSPYMESSAQNH